MTDYTIWLPNHSADRGNSFFQLLPPALDALRPVIGSPGADALTTSGDDERVAGLDGRDSISGEGGNDLLRGGSGRDHLRGGAGDDVLKGGGGKDDLHGGDGADILVGGKGRDTFHVEPGSGDVIADFEPGVDRIEVAGRRVSTEELGLIDADVKIISSLEFTLGVGARDDDADVVPKDVLKVLSFHDDLSL
jgi:Ca2+-binding RTX toxin-like protein